MKRTVILHYHLFKNAGTSVDAVLKRSFGERWITREFPANGGDNSGMIGEWIRDNPDAVAFSSHTMMGPIPQVQDVRIITFMLIRDPIERIQSAYRFERRQKAETWGAKLAKKHDFEGYVRARLERPGDRQCRNFQVHRLAALCPGEGSELDQAKTAAGLITVLGTVKNFSLSIDRLAAVLEPDHLLQVSETWENRSNHKLDQDTDLGFLRNLNQDDYELCAFVTALEDGE